MKFLSYPRPLSLILLAGALTFISGCSANMNMPDTQGTSDFGTIHGGVFGGQQPITAAHIYVFETPSAGTPGYGNTQPISLIGHAGSSVTCNSSVHFPVVYDSTTGFCSYLTGGYNGTSGTNNLPAGEFQLTGIYKCDVGQNVWLYSVGGYPLNGTTNYNPYATLMADLGPCLGTAGGTSDFSGDTFIYMNELSTAAMAYAVAGFTGDTSVVSNSGVHTLISGPSSNATGINNAFLNAQQLYNIFGLTDQGDLSAPQTTTAGARNGVPPFYLINTIGDALAACINSGGNGPGGTGPSSNCTNLFVDSYNNSSPPITDTASAVFYLAQHPTNGNTAAFLSLANSNPVWLPNFSSGGAPNFKDFSAAINYSQSAISTPSGVVTDELGDVFLNTPTNMVKLSPLGAVTSSRATTNAVTIAIDSAGYIWAPTTDTYLYKVANKTTFSSVTKLTPPLTTGKTDAIAADNSGYVYVVDPSANNGEIYKTNAAGSTTTIKSSTLTGETNGTGCGKGANSIAVDSDGYLWITGTGNANNRGSVCRVNSTGTAVTAGTAANAVTQPTAVAVDGSNNAWVINGTGNVVYKVGIGSGGVASVSNAFGGGGLSGNPSAGPVALTVDGSGNIWTVNYNSTTSFSSISELSSSGVGISDSNYGYQGGNITQPTGISVDISGDLWVANTGGGGVVEVIGIATPTAAYLKMTPGTKP